jgi:seryl-tRNA synthetase
MLLKCYEALFSDTRMMEVNTMTDLKRELQTLGEELRQGRDELRLEIALAKAEIRDDWDELEKQWHDFSRKLKSAGHEAAESSDDVGIALAALGKELQKGYQRIRKAL